MGPPGGSTSPGIGDPPAPPFPRVEGELTAAGVALPELAERFGTPLYVYDGDRIEEDYLAFPRAFPDLDLLVAYSVKANGNLGILSRLGGLGSGADIVSAGELLRCRRAAIPPERIVFAGVGKTRDEMEAALAEGIHAFHVESAGELRLLDAVARDRDARAPVGIRVNPDVTSPTPHEYTRTGHAASKFGVPVEEAIELYRWARERPNLEIRGVDVHIGSQIVDPEPYVRALDTVLEVADALRDEGVGVEYLDLGGGFGVGYDGEPGFLVEDLAREVTPPLRDRGLRLILEPGRSVVGEAGILVTRVLYVKRSGGKVFVIVDGGMNDLLRPSHYGGFHRIEPVRLPAQPSEVAVDVVGPICESGDFLARDRRLSVPEPGDLLAVGHAGAYGFTMASNYNARPRPAEVLMEGGRAHLVRERETFDDLVRGERIPEEGKGGR